MSADVSSNLFPDRGFRPAQDSIGRTHDVFPIANSRRRRVVGGPLAVRLASSFGCFEFLRWDCMTHRADAIDPVGNGWMERVPRVPPRSAFGKWIDEVEMGSGGTG